MEEQRATETPVSDSPLINQPKRSKRPFIIVLGLLLAGAIGVGVFYAVRGALDEPAPVEYGVEDHVQVFEPPNDDELKDAMDRQGFGGTVTEFADGKITLRNESGEIKTLSIGNSTPVYQGAQSIETSLDSVRVGMVINVGYIESTQEVESVWLD